MGVAVAEPQQEERTVAPTGLQDKMLCERYAYLGYYRRLTLPYWSPKLRFGSAFHEAARRMDIAAMRGEEVAVADLFDEALSQQVAEHMANFPDVPPPEDELDELRNLGRTLLPLYAEFEPEFGPHIKHIMDMEQPYELTTPAGNVSRGRLDAVVEDRAGRIWVLDRKTCSQFPRDIKLKHSVQAGIYSTAAWLYYGDRFAGFIFDHIRKQMPGPRVKAPLFKRYEIPFNKHEATHWLRLIDEGAAWLEKAKTSNTWSMPYSPSMACEWCPFTEVCLACRQLDSESIERMVSSQFVVRPRYAEVSDDA